MRTFSHPNFHEDQSCPICGLKTDLPIILVPIAGTANGGNIQAIQVHEECIESQLIYCPEQQIIICNPKS